MRGTHLRPSVSSAAPRSAARVFAILLFVLLVQTWGTAQEKRFITETDMLDFVWTADPQVSPDGDDVVYVRVVVNKDKDDYETSLWIVPADGSADPRPLTSGTRDASPRWSPDGSRLAFTRTVERNGRTEPGQVFLLSLDGGEAYPVTDLPRGAGAPVWSPDGAAIAFSSTTRPDDFPPEDGDADSQEKAKPTSDVRVITKATYRSNGRGWVDPTRPSHIWTLQVPDGVEVPTPTQVTSGDFSEGGFLWSHDGRYLLFTSTRSGEPYYEPSQNELFAVPAAGGTPAALGRINGTIRAVNLAPDGSKLAFTGTLNGTPERSHDQTDLFVAEITTGATGLTMGTPRNLTADYDFNISGGVGGDQRAPRGGGSTPPVWTDAGTAIVIASGERGNGNLVRVAADTGNVTPVYAGEHAVQAYSATPDGAALVAVVSTQTRVNDLFAIDTASAGDTAAARQITHVNKALFDTLRLSEPEQITWKAADGRTIEGWLLHPPDFDKSKKYPLILEIHGGPHSAYGNTFTHEFQWMAAKGYVVLYPNPRGSSNYGQEFGNIIQFHYPGDDFKDLMAGIDAVVARGYIDESRMGVTGGSGGGLLTNWTITQTDRFAAAVSQRSIADWSGFWYTADFTLFTPSWFHKAPWEDPEDFVARSPITHIAAVKTPLMLVDGDEDLRTPPADGGEMMFRALKYMKVPTVMVRFPGETHELSRSGKPSHRIERLQHIVGWFDVWLQGKDDPYGVRP